MPSLSCLTGALAAGGVTLFQEEGRALIDPAAAHGARLRLAEA